MVGPSAQAINAYATQATPLGDSMIALNSADTNERKNLNMKPNKDMENSLHNSNADQKKIIDTAKTTDLIWIQKEYSES